jgi:hypothetical protein
VCMHVRVHICESEFVKESKGGGGDEECPRALSVVCVWVSGWGGGV